MNRRDRDSDREVTHPFAHVRRGSFVLRLGTGRAIRFRDERHRASAIDALNNGRFSTLVAYVDCALNQPNGYTAFLPFP